MAEQSGEMTPYSFGECGSPPLTRGDAGHTSRIWLVSGRDKTFGLDYQYLKFVHGSTSYEQVVQPSRPLYTSCRRISSRGRAMLALEAPLEDVCRRDARTPWHRPSGSIRAAPD